MSQPSSPSNEELCLLRRVLGIRLESDGRFEIPLRNTWKAFSRVEFFAIWIVLPYWAIMDDRASRNAAHFGTYLVAAFALYLGLAAFLVVRREFSTHLYSGVGALAQRKQTHALSITGAVLGSTKNKRQPFLLLDGVQFPLATPIFASKEKRLAAVQVLREWTSPVEGTCSACPNGKAAFLSLLDVTSVEKDTIKALDLASSTSFGFGRKLIKNDRQDLEFRLGMNYLYESYTDDTKFDSPGLDIALLHAYQFTNSKLVNRLAFTPAFKAFSNYRLHQESSWEMPVGASMWKLKFGVANDYNSKPPAGTVRLDTTYFTSLVLNWQ